MKVCVFYDLDVEKSALRSDFLVSIFRTSVPVIATLCLLQGLWGFVEMVDDVLLGSTNSQTARQQIADRLSLTPMRSDLWLQLFATSIGMPLDLRLKTFEMATLTGAEKTEDLPARLRIAVASPDLATPVVRDRVKADIALILRTAPSLKPNIALAYKSAGSANKRILLAVIEENDPLFADQLSRMRE